MKFKRFIGLLLLFSLILSVGITASARTPYANYYIQEKENENKKIKKNHVLKYNKKGTLS